MFITALTVKKPPEDTTPSVMYSQTENSSPLMLWTSLPIRFDKKISQISAVEAKKVL